MRSDDEEPTVTVVPFANQETVLQCSDSDLVQFVDGMDYRIQSPGFPEKPPINSRYQIQYIPKSLCLYDSGSFV